MIRIIHQNMRSTFSIHLLNLGAPNFIKQALLCLTYLTDTGRTLVETRYPFSHIHNILNQNISKDTSEINYTEIKRI